VIEMKRLLLAIIVTCFFIVVIATDLVYELYTEAQELNYCESDFDRDLDVDADDVTKFLEDFGRSVFNNPCPECPPNRLIVVDNDDNKLGTHIGMANEYTHYVWNDDTNSILRIDVMRSIIELSGGVSAQTYYESDDCTGTPLTGYEIAPYKVHSFDQNNMYDWDYIKVKDGTYLRTDIQTYSYWNPHTQTCVEYTHPDLLTCNEIEEIVLPAFTSPFRITQQ
jgi:hypothetical protein